MSHTSDRPCCQSVYDKCTWQCRCRRALRWNVLWYIPTGPIVVYTDIAVHNLCLDLLESGKVQTTMLFGLDVSTGLGSLPMSEEFDSLDLFP